MRKDIYQKLNTIISEELNIEKVNPNDSLEELGADSLDIIEIASEVEEKFKISLDDNEVATVETVRDLARIVQSKLS